MALIAMLLQVSQAYTAKPNHGIEKPVVITTTFAPNYLWHLMAVAEISYTSEYASRYTHTAYSPSTPPIPA